MRRAINHIVLLVLSATAFAAATDSAIARDNSIFDGVWRSQGYGWIWKVENGKVAEYDIGADFCIRSEHDDDASVGAGNDPQLSDDGRMLRLRREDPDYIYTFERLSELPARCTEKPRSDPRTAFEAAAAMIGDHYVFFKERNIDWPRLVERARGNIKPDMSDAQLFGAIEKLLTPFGDSHVGIYAEIDDEDWGYTASNKGARVAAEGSPAADGSWNYRAAQAMLGRKLKRIGDLRYGLFANDIGYLEVRSMDTLKAEKLNDALDDIMSEFEGAKAVIVDVSMNDGGRDSYARQIASRFARERTIAYSKHAGDAANAQPQDIALVPTDKPQYLGPVFLITSQETLSAAEIFTIAMRALPNVVHVGETTDGSLSDELWKTLPNGWAMSLSNEIYLDAKGELWEGKGILPHIPLAVVDRPPTKDDRKTVSDVLDFIDARIQKSNY